MCTKQNTERLAKAVFANNLEEIKRIIDDGNFDHVIFEDVFKGSGIKDASVPPLKKTRIGLMKSKAQYTHNNLRVNTEEI